MSKSSKASKHSTKKEQLWWVPPVLLVTGAYMLFLQVPYVTPPPLKSLAPVSCGIPQALKSLYRGGNQLICAPGNEIIFTGGLSGVYGILSRCIDAHRII